MSARNTGTPFADRCSAMTCSVLVLPVPVAPAIRPCRFSIPIGIRTCASGAGSPSTINAPTSSTGPSTAYPAERPPQCHLCRSGSPQHHLFPHRRPLTRADCADGFEPRTGGTPRRRGHAPAGRRPRPRRMDGGYGHLRSLSEPDLGYRIIYQNGDLSERPFIRTASAARYPSFSASRMTCATRAGCSRLGVCAIPGST